MNRSRALDRRYRRILAVSFGVSVGMHALLLALRFDIPLLANDLGTVEFERAEAADPFEDAVEVVAFDVLQASAPSGPMSDAAPAAPGTASAGGSVVSIAVASDAPAPAVQSDLAYEELRVFDPLSSGDIEPVAFTDLPEAVTDAAAEASLEGDGEDDVPVYVPGSIGQAKRRWSGDDGTNTLGDGRGSRVIFGGGGGNGGHCPMPGKVPPIWK